MSGTIDREKVLWLAHLHRCEDGFVDAIRALPAIAPAQIRADALREAAGECDRHAEWIERENRQGVYSAEGCLRTSARNIRAMIDQPAPDPVANAARVLLDAAKASSFLLVNADDPAIEALAIEYSCQGGDAVIVLETAEKFMLAALRAIAEGQL